VRKTHSVDEPVATARVLSYGLLAVLVGISVHGWLLGKHYDTARNDYFPRTISELKGFNGADNRLLTKVSEMGLQNALVLVKNCPHWQCYGTVFWKNAPDFNGDIIYARDLPQIQEVLSSYSDRGIYLAEYSTRTIVPYESPLGPPNPSGGH
jgi:hypothetical protein